MNLEEVQAAGRFAWHPGGNLIYVPGEGVLLLLVNEGLAHLRHLEAQEGPARVGARRLATRADMPLRPLREGLPDSCGNGRARNARRTADDPAPPKAAPPPPSPLSSPPPELTPLSSR